MEDDYGLPSLPVPPRRRPLNRAAVETVSGTSSLETQANAVNGTHVHNEVNSVYGSSSMFRNGFGAGHLSLRTAGSSSQYTRGSHITQYAVMNEVSVCIVLHSISHLGKSQWL